jgi:hypothetical protein
MRYSMHTDFPIYAMGSWERMHSSETLAISMKMVSLATGNSWHSIRPVKPRRMGSMIALLTSSTPFLECIWPSFLMIKEKEVKRSKKWELVFNCYRRVKILNIFKNSIKMQYLSYWEKGDIAFGKHFLEFSV